MRGWLVRRTKPEKSRICDQTPAGEKSRMYKTLIIDDEKPVRIAVSKLGNWGKYHLERPLEAENGREGLRIMRECKPVIVFLDMQMPVMNGKEFLKEASKEFKGTAFIVLSGYDDFEYTQSAVRFGAFDYLLKPVVEEELNETIGRAMKALYPGEDFLLGENPSNPEAEEVLELIREEIDKRYSDNIKVSDFAEQYYFSGEYLSRLFKLRYGKNIYEYLLMVRMERAKELLSSSGLKIQEIAQRTGYSDTNYFSKAFRNYTGLTPSEYRKGAS